MSHDVYTIMKKKVIIVGGGISGLALAWYLQKRAASFLDIQLLEKSHRAGGWLYTKELSGFLFEMGPRTFKTSKSKALLELIHEVGLSDALQSSSKDSHKRFIFHNGKLELLPSNPLALCTSPLTRRSFFSFLKEPFIFPGTKDDESIFDFVSRRFDPQIAKKLFDPFTLGIYAGDIKRLSIKSCFPALYEWEQMKGSLTAGIFSQIFKRKPRRAEASIYSHLSHVGLFTILGGNYRLVERLLTKLQIDFQYNTEVLFIRPKEDKIEVITPHKTLIADQLFLATPATVTAKLLNFLEKPIISYLEELKTATLGAVYLGYKKRVLKEKGFGYLIPSSEGESVLGVVWDSIIFPDRNRFEDETRLTVVMGGMHHPEVTDFSKEKCIELAKAALKRHLNIYVKPDAVGVTLAKNMAPQFEVGHSKKLLAFEHEIGQKLRNVEFVGNYLEGVSVNACVERAKKIADKYHLKNILF